MLDSVSDAKKNKTRTTLSSRNFDKTKTGLKVSGLIKQMLRAGIHASEEGSHSNVGCGMKVKSKS